MGSVKFLFEIEHCLGGVEFELDERSEGLACLIF